MDKVYETVFERNFEYQSPPNEIGFSFRFCCASEGIHLSISCSIQNCVCFISPLTIFYSQLCIIFLNSTNPYDFQSLISYIIYSISLIWKNCSIIWCQLCGYKLRTTKISDQKLSHFHQTQMHFIGIDIIYVFHSNYIE